MNKCKHVSEVNFNIKPISAGCADCLKKGDVWVHLRLCLTCGYVGCCDSSRNKHASKHAEVKNHPIIKSFEPGESWIWCFIDKIYIE